MKRSLLVALADGAIERPICNRCYGTIAGQPHRSDELDELETITGAPRPVPPPATKARKEDAPDPPPSTKAKRQPEQEKKLSKAEKKRGERQAARNWEREFERRAAREAGSLFRFFHRAGIAANVRNGEIVVNGKRMVGVGAVWGLPPAALEDLRDKSPHPRARTSSWSR